MQVQTDISLKDYSTMRLGGVARFLCQIQNEDDLLEALAFAKSQNCKVKIIGTGSNIVWTDSGFNGFVIVNKIESFEIDNETVSIGAGVDWDEAVARTVSAGLSGVEFLSLIPGTAGATPVQNVGAYGREIKDVLVRLRAYDMAEQKFLEISNEECDFAYRKSRFNSYDADRFVIISINLKLSSEPPKPPFYESLQRYLDENSITEYNPKTVREAVIAIRTAKLPDPDYIANNGSFFANPVLEPEDFNRLKTEHEDIVGWDHKGKMKISAAWLIEQAGFKDFHDPETGMATWATQPLVLINENAKSYSDLEKFKAKIVKEVNAKFHILLEQEPETVDA